LQSEALNQNSYKRFGLSTRIFLRVAASGTHSASKLSTRPSSIGSAGAMSVSLRPSTFTASGCGQSVPRQAGRDWPTPARVQAARHRHNRSVVRSSICAGDFHVGLAALDEPEHRIEARLTGTERRLRAGEMIEDDGHRHFLELLSQRIDDR
jgi:hypothetical protein